MFDCTIPSNTLSRAELNYESGSVRNIHYGDILIKYGSVVDVQNDEIPFATGKSSDDFKGALLQDGDIIIADTAEDETTGKACEIGNSQGLDVVSGLHTMVCRPRNKMALGYLGYYLNSDAYHHQLLPLMQGIKVLSLSRINVQKTTVCYPESKLEQQLIADCFRNLDHLITLHHRKLNSSSRRETFAWEQRKFNEFVKNVAKKNKDNLDLEPFAVTNDRGFIAQKDAHEDFGYMKDTDRRAYNIVPPNSFAYNPARINVGSLGYYAGTENVIVSSLYEVFQTEDFIDDRFLWHWLKSEHFPKWIEKLQEGSVRLYFYFDKLIQCQMMIPSVEEQKIISEYLDRIDTLITLHHRKYEELQKIKKFMLQNMFV